MNTPHQPLADKVLERIEEQHVAPRPRWVFVVKNTAFWALWVLSLLIGAFAMAAALFVFTNAGWEFRELTHPMLTSFLLENVPLLWIVALCLMLIFGIENVRHTKGGYRYPMILLFTLNLLGSAAFGFALFKIGAGQFVDQEVGGKIPFHRPMLIMQERRWTKPQHGLISGAVLDVEDDFAQFTIQAFDGKIMYVSGGDLNEQGRDALTRFPFVRVVGLPQAEQATATMFHACFVLPWELNGGRFPPPPARKPRALQKRAAPTAGFAEGSPCANLQKTVPPGVLSGVSGKR